MSKMVDKDELAKRMKTYENATRPFLTLGVPKVIRVDMRAGGTFCRNLEKPFDKIFSNSMLETAKAMCMQIPGAKFAYTQSDEISIALNDDFGNVEYSCFFDGNLEKIVSISASIATLEFNKAWRKLVDQYKQDLAEAQETGIDPTYEFRLKRLEIYESKLDSAMFDSRVVVLPNETELHNYFVWRQQDATRNSILAVGNANFTQKEIDNKNTSEIQDMLMLERGINWNNFPVGLKRGFVVIKELYKKEVQANKWTASKRGISKTYEVSGEAPLECIRSRWSIYPDIPIFTQATEFIPRIFYKNVFTEKDLEELNNPAER